jgi:hypothetical protein
MAFDEKFRGKRANKIAIERSAKIMMKLRRDIEIEVTPVPVPASDQP